MTSHRPLHNVGFRNPTLWSEGRASWCAIPKNPLYLIERKQKRMKPLVQIGLLVLFCGVWCNVITAAETDTPPPLMPKPLLPAILWNTVPKIRLKWRYPKQIWAKRQSCSFIQIRHLKAKSPFVSRWGKRTLIRVYDMYGKLHKNIGIDGTSTQAVITNLPTGVYLLHLTRKGKPLDSQKLIIAR